MATSAFKSTTRRTPVGAPADDSPSSSTKSLHHRRSRSLSRFSRRLVPDAGEVPTPRGKFVNTVRGSGFPEISLDDLAIEFFPAKDDSVEELESEENRRRSSRRSSDISPSMASTQRRGRSVSRQSSKAGDGKVGRSVSRSSFRDVAGGDVSVRIGSASNGGGSRGYADATPRRRRSVSVARRQISDSESDIDHLQQSTSHYKMRGVGNGNSQIASSQKPTVLSHRKLGRSASQKDLSMSNDGYSSQSSALTDDDSRDARHGRKEIEKTIRAVYAQKKTDHPTGEDVNHGLCETMRKELRSAVDEIKMELEQVMLRKPSALANSNHPQSDNSDVFQVVSAIRKNYATKLQQSEQRKQDLLAEMALEEQRGKELSKIVKGLLPGTKSSDVVQKVSHSRKRSNDKNRMSRCLDEEAEKYFEEFLSNVEDTDYSSFDGERSDTSSTLGGITKQRDVALHGIATRAYPSPAGCNSLPVEMEGVILPWLKWETSNDGNPRTSNNKTHSPVTPKTLSWDAAQEEGTSTKEPTSHSESSRGSWSPGLVDAHSIIRGEKHESKYGENGNPRCSRFDMDRYMELRKSEELLFESWRERNRISSGGLLLCSNLL